MVMPYCNEPLEGLLSQSTGYETEWLATRVPLRHVNLLLYRLEVCAEPTPVGSLAPLPPRVAAVAEHFRSVEVVPVDAKPEAWETARYLLHLVRCYERLADFTLFLHPDVFEHVNPRTLRNVLQSLQFGTFRHSGLGDGRWYEYLSLSHNYLLRPSRAKVPSANCTDARLDFHDLWNAVFGLGGPAGLEEEPGDFGFYCCSQFMVHRDSVRQRPREWYRRVADDIAWEHCATSYMELLW